jgi:hypothetical protein
VLIGHLVDEHHLDLYSEFFSWLNGNMGNNGLNVGGQRPNRPFNTIRHFAHGELNTLYLAG